MELSLIVNTCILTGIMVVLLRWVAPASECVTFDQVELRFASKEEGMAALACQDAFLSHLGGFDRGARFEVDRDVSQEEFESFIVNQVVTWEPEDIEQLTAAFETVAAKMVGLKPVFPPVILLVRTTGLEEGHSTYCRCDNAIVFGGELREIEQEALVFILTHELFHILSRNNDAIKERLYSIVGFSRTAELELDSVLRDRKITNPDAARNDNYFTSTVGTETLALMPLIVAKSPYDTNEKKVFFDYLELFFVAVDTGQQRCSVRRADGKPMLVHPSQVPEYFALIGQNTEYIIHPEEVLADNFALMITGTVVPPGLSFTITPTVSNTESSMGGTDGDSGLNDARESLPNPEIIDRMKEVLLR